MFAWRGGRGRHYAKSTQGRQNQVGPPGVQNPGYAPEKGKGKRRRRKRKKLEREKERKGKGRYGLKEK